MPALKGRCRRLREYNCGKRDTVTVAILIAICTGLLWIGRYLGALRERIDSLAQHLDGALRSLESLSNRFDHIDEILDLSAPAHVRDRLAFRRAKDLTIDAIRSWLPGHVFRLIDADWDLDHEEPMISKYQFRFLSIDEHCDGELGWRVRGEWRFGFTEQWREHSSFARETSADVKLQN